MFPMPNPEALSSEWLAPIPIGREREVQEAVRRLAAPSPTSPPPWLAVVAGPAGSGTSTVARRAAREVVERLRRSTAGPPARVLAVRVGPLKGPHGVATALLRLLDEGFEGRGFSMAEILAGLLRRLRREQRPFVVVLDDIVVGSPDLGPVLRALAEPDRFLPEGEHGLPPHWTVLAGTPEGLMAADRGCGSHERLPAPIVLAPYPSEVLEAILRDRAQRALGRPLPEALLGRVMARLLEEGGGSRRAVELLRRELLGGRRGYGPGFIPRGGEPTVHVEPSVVDAIEEASRGSVARLGEVRRREGELARRRGSAPLPTTTFWRRIVRLEQAGYVRREIRTGGAGGTRSLLRVLTPIDEWVTAPSALQTHRGGEGPGVALAPAPAVDRTADWPSVPVG